MVFAANGATVIDGVVLGAQFTFPERAAEGPAYLDWFARRGFEVHEAKSTNEGEGDLRVCGDFVLAGTGFRTELAAHAETQELFGRPVVTLQLVDPRYYHLDTALAVLSPTDIAYFPGAFSPGSQAVLRRMFPDAILAARRGRGRARPQRGQRRPPGRAAEGRDRPDRPAGRARLRARAGRRVGAAQGRRRPEVLHAGGGAVSAAMRGIAEAAAGPQAAVVRPHRKPAGNGAQRSVKEDS